MSTVTSILNYLIDGDPLDPQSTDLIAQRGYLAVPEPLPRGEGWRVLSGNHRQSVVARVVYRFEIEGGE